MLESRVREGALKAEELTTRNAQLDAELRTLKLGTARYQEVITQLQEAKRQLESENQRLIQSSMSAQADVRLFHFVVVDIRLLTLLLVERCLARLKGNA